MMMMMMAMIMAMILKIWIVWNTVCMQLLPSPLIRSGHFHICIRSFCGNTFTFSIWYISQSLPHPTKENLIVKILAPSEKSWPCLSENIWHLLVFTFSVLPVSIFVDIRHHCWIPDRCTVKAWQWPGFMHRCHSFYISTTFWYVPWLMQRNWCLRTVSCFGQDEKGLKFSSEPTSRWRRMFKWSEEAGRHNPPI